MFLRLIKALFKQQFKKMILIMLTLALGASLMTAMVNVVLGVEDKVNAELKTYGANIMVQGQRAAVMDDLYSLGTNVALAAESVSYADYVNLHSKNAAKEQVEKSDQAADGQLTAADLTTIKQIFWGHNITNFLPVKNLDNLFLTVGITPAEALAKSTGYIVNAKITTFSADLRLADGEIFNYGLATMKNWWEIKGALPTQEREVLLGNNLASSLNLVVGDKLTLSTFYGTQAKSVSVTVAGIFTAGDAEDNYLYATDAAIGSLSEDDKYSYIEVQALTTPDNDLARKAAKNPLSLTSKEWDTWYCTAYVSSVCYQLEDALKGVSAKAIRQVAESEGGILKKTKSLLTLIAVLAMLATTLSITNLISNFVMERSGEIGLSKALGAETWRLVRMVWVEILIAGLSGATLGYFFGLLFTEIIAWTVFSTFIVPAPVAIPLLLLMVVLVTTLGSVPALHYLSKLDPKIVLHNGK